MLELVPAWKTSVSSILIDDTDPTKSMRDLKFMTLEQEKFILAHELGHIALKHHDDTKKYTECKLSYLIEKLEYEADLFAYNWYKSELYNDLFRFSKARIDDKKLNEAVASHMLFCGNIELIFIYFDIFERYHEYLSDVCTDLKIPCYLPSIPKPLSRYERIKMFHINEFAMSNGFNDYIKDLLNNSITYMCSLPKDEFIKKVKEIML